MKAQTIKISEPERQLVSDFIGEDIGAEIDWNGLMPVVEKIGMLHYNDRQNKFNPSLGNFLENDIEIIYSKVVAFIQWYQNKKS